MPLNNMSLQSQLLYFIKGFNKIFFLQFLLEDARSNEAVSKSTTKSHIPSSLDANADTTITLPLRRHSPKEVDDKGELVTHSYRLTSGQEKSKMILVTNFYYTTFKLSIPPNTKIKFCHCAHFYKLGQGITPQCLIPFRT